MSTTHDVLPGSRYDKARRYETLEDLATEILRQQETKRDYVVDTRRMAFSTTADGGSILSFDQGDPYEGVVSGGVREHAHGQIADRLGIPTRYYRRLREEAPELLDRNVGYWFANVGDRRLIRMLDGDVRAFLSDRYRRIDNIDLMHNAILPALGGDDGLHFQVAALSDSRMHLNIILPRVQAEIRVGDVVQAGVQISNSEIGSGALRVLPRLWRLVCLNGMIVPSKAMSKYHVGRKADEDAYEIYRDDTLAADDVAFYLKVRDALTAALDETRFESLVATLRDAAESTPIVNPVAATRMLTQKYDLADTESTSILRHLSLGGDLSQWGLVNALTAAAKDADDFAREAEIEMLGGEVAALDGQVWSTIAAAA